MNLFWGLLLLSLVSGAQDFKSAEVKGIRIVGWKGQLTLIPDAKSDLIRHKFKNHSNDVNFTTSAQVEDGWLEIRVNGPTSKQDWRNEIPKIDLEIRARPMPVVASWVEGDVAVKGWSAPFQLTHKSGKVRIDEGRESYKLSLHEGELDILKFSGQLDVDNYAAKVSIKRFEGRAKLENFQGKLSVEDSRGDVILKTVQGKNSIEDLAGTLDFENNKGEVAFTQGEGTVQGKSIGGVVDGKIKGAVEVRIRGEEPRLTLSLIKGTGARVDIGTSKGSLSSGLGLKIDRGEELKLMRGQVNGSRVASLFVRLQSGDIRLR